MAQKRVTEFFQNRKRAEIQYDVNPSKRAKVEPRTLRSKPVDTEIEPDKSEKQTIALTTAYLDDHNSILPSTPTKRSLRSDDSISSKKRSRGIDTPDPPERCKTPHKGYDFSVFASGGKSLEDTSARRRLLKNKLEPHDRTPKIKSQSQNSALPHPARSSNAFEVKKQTDNLVNFCSGVKSVLNSVGESSFNDSKDCQGRIAVGAETAQKNDSKDQLELESCSRVFVNNVKSSDAPDVKVQAKQLLKGNEVADDALKSVDEGCSNKCRDCPDRMADGAKIQNKYSPLKHGKEELLVDSYETVNTSSAVKVKSQAQKLVKVNEVADVLKSVDTDCINELKDSADKITVGSKNPQKASSANGGNEQPGSRGDASQREKVEKSEDNVELMKKKLANCTSLVQLREALAQCNQAKAKLKQVIAGPKEKPNNKQKVKQREVLGKFEVDIGILKKRLAESDLAKSKVNQTAASASKVQTEQQALTSEQSSEVKVPAHDRFHALGAKVPPSLILPFSYGNLLEVFNCAEIIVSRLHNRHEICTFSKLKMGVEQMTKKRFEEKHLGQIKTVLPTAYHFCQEKDLPSGGGGKISDYQLTVEAVLNDCKSAESNEVLINKISEDGHKFTPAKLVERRSHFRQNLISVVKHHHAEFLATLKTPLKVPDDKLTRWHALFEVDKVPDIEAASLPQKPFERKIYSAQEALELVRNKCDKRVQQALEKVANKSSSSSSATSVRPNSPGSKAPPSGLVGNKSQGLVTTLKGIDPELLARVRAKEAFKATQQMTQTPEEQQRLERLQRLPQLVLILKCYFDGQKRPAIPIDDAIGTFVDSYRTSISPVEAEQHLRLLAETVPEWVTLVRISRGEYVKVDRNLDVNMIASKVQKLADNFQ